MYITALYTLNYYKKNILSDFLHTLSTKREYIITARIPYYKKDLTFFL